MPMIQHVGPPPRSRTTWKSLLTRMCLTMPFLVAAGHCRRVHRRKDHVLAPGPDYQLWSEHSSLSGLRASHLRDEFTRDE